MKLRFRKAQLAAGLLFVFIVSACSNDSEKDGASKTTKEIPKEAVSAPANLTIYSTSGWTEQAFNERFGDAMRKKFPQITFTYIQSQKGMTYPDLMAAQQPIDIIWESIGMFPRGPLQYGTQYDMTELIKLHNVDISRIEPTLLDVMAQMSGGKMYALPVINNTVILYYNKDIFDKFGTAYPKDGMTWDEVLDLNTRLTREDGSVQYAGLGLGHYFATNSFSLSYVDPNTNKPTIADTGWKALYQVYTRMAETEGYKNKIRSLNRAPDVKSFVVDKDTAMFAGLANTHMNQDMSSLNWDAVAYPTFKETPRTGPQSYPTYFGVSGISKHKDQAMDVIKYLVSDSFQLEVSKKGVLPVIKSAEVKEAFGKDTAFVGKNVKAAFYDNFAPVAPRTYYDGEVEKIYSNDIVKLMLGETDLNTLMRNAEEAATKKIAEMKK